MGQLQRIAELLAKLMAAISACCLVGMITITTANIILRRPPFVSPLLGAHELTAFLGAMVIAFALPLTQLRRGNIGVELLQGLMPRAMLMFFERATLLVCGVISAIISWRLLVYAAVLRDRSEVSMTLGIPFFPFIMVAGGCFIVLALVFVIQMIAAEAEAAAPEPDKSPRKSAAMEPGAMK